MRQRAAVFAVVAIIVGLYYRWGVRAAGEEFHWGYNLDGYYNLLARGFIGGHLYLPAEVQPELLAKPDPWDPAIDDSLKLFDAALFHKHYYLYHGAAPAILLFVPWRLITGHDVPENFASFLFCYFGFFFSGGALLALLHLAGKSPGPFTTGILLLGVGFCQGVPFLLNRTWVYEIAIAGGYFCVSAALFFLLRGSPKWIAASGLACGFAIACRPHLGLFAVAFGLFVLVRDRRNLIAFAAPVIIAGIAIGIYNYERFGNPAEFGIRYLLTGRNQNHIELDVENIRPAAFYFLAAAPQTDRIFPWVRMAWPPQNIARPKKFFLEPTTGIIWLAPFLPALLLLPRLGRARLPVALMAIASIGVFLFLACTGWSTQRYDVDFLPMLALASLAAAGTLQNTAGKVVLGLLIVAGVIVNLAIAVGGPIDEMIQKRPDRYVRLSRMFTPVERYRLRLNPPFSFGCPLAQGYGRQMILSLGTPVYTYELFYTGANLVSRRAASDVRVPLEKIKEVKVAFDPASLEIIVSESGEERLRHRTGALTAAPIELQGACGGRAYSSR